MKYRESDMPPNDMWETFFDPQDILRKMGVDNRVYKFLDIGCGYGTFLLPATMIVKNKVIGIDIDNDMIKYCRKKVKNLGLKNVELILGDIDTIEKVNHPVLNDIDYIALFNILHCEEPVELLRFSYNHLVVNGKAGVIHWKDEKTPRGPSMEIRPKP